MRAERKKGKKRDDNAGEDGFFFPKPNSAASTNECTGLTPAGVVDNEEAESYGDIYDTHFSDREEKKK